MSQMLLVWHYATPLLGNPIDGGPDGLSLRLTVRLGVVLAEVGGLGYLPRLA